MMTIEQDLAAVRTVAEAFILAASAGDEAGAVALCATSDGSDDGWQAGDSPVRGLYMQSFRKGLVLDLMGEPRKLGGRAAQRIVLSHPSRPRPLGDLWLLLEKTEGWSIAGATKIRQHAGLFLWNALRGPLSVADLDRSERGDALAESVASALRSGVVPDLSAGSELLREYLVDDAAVSVLRSVELLQLQRAAIGFRIQSPGDDFGDEVWLVLDLGPNIPRVIHAGGYLGLEPLFTGVEVDWPQEDPAHPGRALSSIENPMDPQGGRIVLEETVRQILVASGADPAGFSEDDPRAAMVGELLAAIRRMAPQPGERPGDTSLQSGEAALKPTPEAPAPLSLPPDVQEQVETTIRVLQEKQKLTGKLSREDERAFVEQHGAALVSGIFEALLQTTNPSGKPYTELKVEEGVPHARIDPMALLGDVLKGPVSEDE